MLAVPSIFNTGNGMLLYGGPQLSNIWGASMAAPIGPLGSTQTLNTDNGGGGDYWSAHQNTIWQQQAGTNGASKTTILAIRNVNSPMGEDNLLAVPVSFINRVPAMRQRLTAK
jgi:hypothetical protein